MTAIEMLDTVEHTVSLKKLNETSSVDGCAGLATFLGLKQDQRGRIIDIDGRLHPLVKHYAPVVWICCIGRKENHFGISAEHAASAAIQAHLIS